jgi:hypothetical protein
VAMIKGHHAHLDDMRALLCQSAWWESEAAFRQLDSSFRAAGDWRPGGAAQAPASHGWTRPRALV